MEQNEIDALTAKSETKSRRMTEEQIVAKYPNHNIKPGSLHTVDGGRKQAVILICACGNEREVRTSDLFQVTVCRDCKKAQRKAAKEQAQAEAPAEAEAPAPTEAEAPTEDLAAVADEALEEFLNETEAEVA